MPIYEYECNACGEQHEFIQKLSESPKRKCPACGKLRLRKLISAAAFHLKGSGWYVTDFRDGGKKKPAEDGDSAKATSDSPSGGEGKPQDNATESSGSKAESKSSDDAKASAKNKSKSKPKSSSNSGKASPAS
ncbi:MAG: putative FmdB family regulatory protein [Gammaproteobacteria bacterium]|jgi:putative FmdB family regulatory protein